MSDRGIWVSIAAGSMGIAAWMWIGSGAVSRYPFPWLLATLVAIALGVSLVMGASFARVGTSVGVGSIALTPLTATRGDGDGLWILLVGALAVWAYVLAAIGRRVDRCLESRRRIRMRPRWARISVPVLALSAAVASIFAFWPRSDVLERTHKTIGLGTPLRLVHVSQSGSPLCTVACSVEVSLMYESPLGLEGACSLLEERLEGWGSERTSRWCRFEGWVDSDFVDSVEVDVVVDASDSGSVELKVRAIASSGF